MFFDRSGVRHAKIIDHKTPPFGGIITNYYCTSKCRHCLYACSPYWDKEYIDRTTLERVLTKVRSLGCSSVHVGGGEPFLNRDGLRMVLETAREMGVSVEYVETNSSWFKGDSEADAVLKDLQQAGLRTLLISMSPFHNEFIPFRKVKGVIEACRRRGMAVFPWIPDFYPEIDTFDDARTHDLSEYRDRFGNDYLARIPGRYWIHYGGRALYTFAGVFQPESRDVILSGNRGGCRELLETGHFHFDLNGCYIPGLCSGLAIRSPDLGRPLPVDEYPLLTVLYNDGINGLLEMARRDYGFQERTEYLSKCHLCTEIRRFLVLEKEIQTKELGPAGFYRNLDR